MGLRYIVLKELVVRYQQTNDPVIFAKILKRMDRLLLNTVYKFAKQNEHLRKIDARELYHTAIVGMGYAIRTSKENETGDKIVIRILEYIEHQFKRFYPKPKEPGVPPPVEYEYREERLDDVIDAHELFPRWLKQGVISEKDYKLLLGKFGEGKTFKVMAAELGMRPITAKVHVRRILKKLRSQPCMKS